ncbi:MAG TPA: hypothetical protein VL359_19925, partial [bacterium]|nr:hypothetical protein [bacterium]
LCWLLLAVQRQRPALPDIVLGAVFGVGNGLANIFLLEALHRVPGVIAFPIRDTGLILLVSLGGMLLWRERPGPWGAAALVLAAAAVLIMGLGG